VQEAGLTTDAMGSATICQAESAEKRVQYYGSPSNISFTRAINTVLMDTKVGRGDRSPGVLPSDFTGGEIHKQRTKQQSASGLSLSESGQHNLDFFTLPPKSISDFLLESYWSKAYPLYPIIHRPTFEAAYAMLWDTSISLDNMSRESNAGLGNRADAGFTSQCFFCGLNMMLALGSQLADINIVKRAELTAMFEYRSKNLLVIDMMDQGSLAVVQVLLLTCQYFQSTLHPQKCWNSTGMACRIAQALGLHTDESPRNCVPLGLEMRRRVWYGCILFDRSYGPISPWETDSQN
jgi:hypothetical protein